jgi:hypothetical protein
MKAQSEIVRVAGKNRVRLAGFTRKPASGNNILPLPSRLRQFGFKFHLRLKNIYRCKEKFKNARTGSGLRKVAP